ncbi:tyrosine-type recombinase/integrase [Paeniglutamicibacter sp. NPDC012692]|uniref:tyrosine-type recombinase/integrase n=1 Tax=Paeniglutamicibacter sp. NPDC012692 TaxID=3364388 RepID=UPI003690ACC8
MEDNHLLDAWGHWQRSANHTAQTIIKRREALEHFCRFTGTTLHGYTTHDVVKFLSRDGLAPNSRATYYRHLKSFACFAVAAGHRKDNPVLAAPKPRPKATLPRPVTPAGLQALLDHAGNPSTYMMVLLAAFQGMRVHEIAKVHGRDVDRYAGSIEISGKGGKHAILPLHAEIGRLMDLHADKFPGTGYWFPSPTRPGLHLHTLSVSARLKRAMDAAGIINRTPHSLRHYFGTTLVRNNVNMRVVQELMRHSSLQSTQIYVAVDDEEQRAGIDTLLLPQSA